MGGGARPRPVARCARRLDAHGIVARRRFPIEGIAGLVRDIVHRHSWRERGEAERLARTYGTRAHVLLDGAGDLGRLFGGGMSEREARYLVRSPC